MIVGEGFVKTEIAGREALLLRKHSKK